MLKGFIRLLGIAVLITGIWACRQSFDNGERPDTGITLDSLVKRVAIPSQSMPSIYNANVILPESYYLDSTPLFYPVVYLLHGYQGDFNNWYRRVPELVDYASEYDMIIVTPDGNSNSWYLDSPRDSASRFFTYISQEVPSYIDTYFRTRTGPRARAITGLSMGGHGALSIGLKHPEWFGAAGSMSGVLDLLPFAGQWEMQRHLGDPVEDSLQWKEFSVIEQVGNQQQQPELIIDCGREDFLLDINRSFHQRLDELSIRHTYLERPGGHAWDYWREAVAYQLLFFDRFFD